MSRRGQTVVEILIVVGVIVLSLLCLSTSIHQRVLAPAEPGRLTLRSEDPVVEAFEAVLRYCETLPDVASCLAGASKSVEVIQVFLGEHPE